MLRINLSLRFCLGLGLSLWLAACSVLPPPVVNNSGGAGSQKAIAMNKKCPASLPGLRQQQALGIFLSCDPGKDGTPFIDVQANIPTPDYQGVWLLVDTEKLQLEVKQGNQTLTTFSNIAIGRSGAGFKNRRGDNVTPVGEYRIGWINDQSPFHIFYGLNYPSLENAKEAFSKNLISDSEYEAIIYAHEHQQIPPQNTALGGQVGLHGLGKGDEKIHGLMNWTHGCIALTNSQLDVLDQWIVEGIWVKIK